MNLVATPWDNPVGKTAKKRVMAVALLFFAVIAMSGLFAAASAKANGIETMVMAQGNPVASTTCNRVIFAGDRHADGLKNTIGESDDIEYAVGSGKDLTQVKSDLEAMNITSGDCVYIDSGILDANELNSGELTDEEVHSRIKEILDLLGSARNVMWVTPVVADEFPADSGLNREDWDPTQFNNILKEEVNKSGNARVVDIASLGSQNDLFSDGVTMTENGYAHRLAALMEESNNGDSSAQMSLTALVDILKDENLLDDILDILGITEDDLNIVDPSTTTDGTTTTTPSTTTSTTTTSPGTGPGTGPGPGPGTGPGTSPGTLPGGGGGGGNEGPSGGIQDNVNRFLRPGAESQIGGQIASSNAAANRSPNGDGDSVAGDISQSSPRAFAQKVTKSSDFTYLNRYLTVHRWHSFMVPSPGGNPLAGGSVVGSIMAALTNFGLVAFATLAASFLGFLTICFSPVFGSIALQIGDAIFGSVIGGIFTGSFAGLGLGSDTDSAAASAALLSALVVTTLVTSAISAFSAENAGKSMRERGMSIVIALAKVMTFFIVVGGIGMQSKKNHDGSDPTQDALTQLVNQINDRDYFGPRDDAAGITLDAQGGISSNYSTKQVTTLTLTDINSWQPLSMGWIVTVVLDIANMLINAVLGIFNAILLYPVSTLASKLDDTTNGGAGLNAPRPACARYVDSMHFAYLNSGAASASPIFAQIMAGMDKIYYRSVLGAYAYGFGDTLTGNNVWCHLLENENGAASGDRIMLGRSTGLWRDAFGSGNLVGSRRYMYTTGQNSIGPRDANTASGNSTTGGIFVNAAGEWESIGSDGKQAPIRADVYFGKSTIESGLPDDNDTKGPDTAAYYFGACEWNPVTLHTTVNREWRGIVLAMPSADPDYEHENPHLNEKDYKEGAHGERGTQGVIPQGHILVSITQEHSDHYRNMGDDEDNATRYIQDFDCYAYQNFPVGEPGTDKANDYGWGSNNRMPDRWYYAPPNVNLMSTVVARASTSNNRIVRAASWLATKSMEAADDVERAKRSIAAQDAFVGSEVQETGRNYAHDFWRSMNGQGETGKVLGAVYYSGVAFIMIAIFMLPAALFGVVINIVFGFILFCIPVVVMINLIIRTLKGGK